MTSCRRDRLLLAAVPGCFAALVVALICAAPPASVRVAAQQLGTDAQRESGKRLYLTYCVQCHGENGDGEGYAASRVLPKPRNFTTGKFKVRTTPSGALPTHEDLVNIIRRGMPYTSMPAWPNLTNQQLSDLAYYLMTFSPDFANPENVPKPVELPSAPRTTDESIQLGRKLYQESGCIRCHGELGRGDGPSAPTLVDDYGQPIRAADLTQRWTFRGGPTREDIFRTMSTGFNGTPMPSFLEALTPEQRWAITDYIVSLSDETPGYTNLVTARRVADPIDITKGVSIFEAAPVARFPIVGQVMEPGRSFNPPVTSVVVQAIYDSESIALLVRWHDMSAERTGKNSPALPVPPEEEDMPTAPAAGGGAAGETAGESIWGEEEAPPAGQAPTEGAQQPADDIWGEEEGAAAGAQAVPPSEFSDAVAVQIPTQARVGVRKPYFIFGDGQNPVDLWFFDSAQSEPLQFTGRGSANITPNDTGEVTGVASYDRGEWSVIFKRPLRPGSGAAFVPGQFMPIAFSVWDGFTRERGNRRGLTTWYSLYMEPEVVTSATGPMIRTALIIFAFELIVIGWVRWRHGALSRPARRRTEEPATSA